MASFNILEIEKLDYSDREQVIIEKFNAVVDEKDYDLAAEIAGYVVEEDRIYFSYAWKLFCIYWLTHFHISRWKKTEDYSSESEKYWKLIYNDLWRYKWMVDNLPQDLDMTLEKICQATEEMEAFYRHFDFSLAMVEKAKMSQAILMGDAQAAREHFTAWQQAGDDGMNDCEACVQGSLLRYYHFIGEPTKVLELAQPILSGEMTCSEIPHIVYRYIIPSLMKLGQIEEAKRKLDEAITLIESQIDEYIYLIPELAQLAYRLGLYQISADLLNNHRTALMDKLANNAYYALHYRIACGFFNEEAKQDAQELAKAFDERHGNQYYQTYLEFLFSAEMVH